VAGGPRFECRQDTGPEGWTVWDNDRNDVASLGGCSLRGRSERCARAACDILTAIYSSRLDFAAARERLMEQHLS
jgi:hypothetical protein